MVTDDDKAFLLNLNTNIGLIDDGIYDIESPLHNILNHTNSYITEGELNTFLKYGNKDQNETITVIHANCRSIKKL